MDLQVPFQLNESGEDLSVELSFVTLSRKQESERLCTVKELGSTKGLAANAYVSFTHAGEH